MTVRPRQPTKQSPRRWFGPQRQRLGLRTRATIGFGVTGLAVALVLATVTYGLTRNNLIDQRQEAAQHQAYVNARLARSVLRTADPPVGALLTSLGGGSSSTSVLQFRGESFSSSVDTGPDAIPADLARLVNEGRAGHQRFRDRTGHLRLAVGVPIAAVDAAYFEVFPLDELDQTLDLLARALAIGVIGAAGAAAIIGRLAANRLVRPLAPIADAAESIAGGALDTRLSMVDDPDLRRLAVAFNAMAEALEERIDREARFAADVSHELRSPLTAVAAALEIIDRRRDQLPAEVTEAFSVLRDKVATFQRLVLDLLEISRVDAGTAAASVDLIDLQHFLPRVLALHGAETATVTFSDDAPSHIRADRRRLAQVVGNIVDNARRYAGGTTAMSVSAPAPGWARLAFDDAGPGVAEAERDAIFGRFARGEIGRKAGAGSGSGLGLSLVAEHLRLQHGRVWVEDSPGGGARFVIELPTNEEVDEGDLP